jgi:integrase
MSAATPIRVIWQSSPVMKVKITERVVDRLPAPDPSGKQKLYWDADLRGFGVLCSGATRAKTFVVQGAVGGRTRRVTIAPANVLSVIEARRRAREVIAAFYAGEDPKAPRRAPTLRQALDAYLAARHSLKPRSARDFRGVVERYLSDWLDKRLVEITGEMVEIRHRSIKNAVAASFVSPRGESSPGGATANAALKNLGAIWAFAAERDAGLPTSPTVRLRRQWFAIRRRERIVRADDLPAFYRAVVGLASPVARDYLLLLLFTGMRKSEAAGLTWSNIDFVERVIRVPAERTKAGRKLDLPMTDFVRDLLVARRTVERAEHVFPARTRAGRIDSKHQLKKVAAACGVEVSAHDLRRTFITIAEGCDVSPIALKALVNHAVGADVTSGYVVMNAERLRAPAQLICDRMKALCGVAPPAAGVAAIG